jgi:hypothetical protein
MVLYRLRVKGIFFLFIAPSTWQIFPPVIFKTQSLQRFMPSNAAVADKKEAKKASGSLII